MHILFYVIWNYGLSVFFYIIGCWRMIMGSDMEAKMLWTIMLEHINLSFRISSLKRNFEELYSLTLDKLVSLGISRYFIYQTCPLYHFYIVDIHGVDSNKTLWFFLKDKLIRCLFVCFISCLVVVCYSFLWELTIKLQNTEIQALPEESVPGSEYGCCYGSEGPLHTNGISG